MTDSRKKRMILYSVLFAVSAVFYLFWYWHDGIVITPDAQSYIDMASARDPGYSFFLWLCRVFAGWGGYQQLAVILQCLLAAVTASAITVGLGRRFNLQCLGTIGVLAIQYGITLLNRFVAQRRYSYYNSIETEAITYSIWIFFFLNLLGIIYDRKKKNVIMGLVWAIILMSTRKQMIVAFGLLFLCLVAAWWKDKKWYLAVFSAGCIVLLGFAGTRLLDCTYNYGVRGVFAPHTGDSSFILGTEIYVADKNMVSYISDKENQELFLEIMNRADALEYNAVYAGKGWHNIEEHYSNSYDRIKFDIVNVVIREEQISKGMDDQERELDANRIMNEMMKELLVPCIPGMFKIFCSNIVHGFVTTVLKVHTVLNWVALFLYIAYTGMIIYLFKMQSGRERGQSSACMAIVVLTAIAVNVVGTSAAIYPQMRYMLYNTGLFYQAAWIMLIEIYRKGRK